MTRFSVVQGGQGADVVQAVGQLDQDDAHVGGHGDDHFFQRFGLGVLDVDLGDLGDLGHPPDDVADLLAEQPGQVLARVLRILDHVVQQAGGDGYLVELHLGQDAGHGQRVGDVGLVGGALLVQVGVGGNGVGFFEQLDIGFGIITEDLLLQFVKALDHFAILYINFALTQRRVARPVARLLDYASETHYP